MKTFLAVFLFSVLSDGAVAQFFDFNSGSDSGWTRLDPLGGFGAGAVASFSLEDGRYRISTEESPSPSLVGPARAGSLRQDVIYQDLIFMSVDFTIPDPSLKQAVGFLVFVQPDPALGTTSGYSLNYQPAENDLILNRVTNEAPTRLDLSALTEVAGESLRLVLLCENGCFTGKLYNSEDLLSPIATVRAKDSTYTSGTAGLFVFSDRDDSTGTTEAIFDNYRANALVTPPIELVPLGGDDFELRWPDWAAHLSPEQTSDLSLGFWSPVMGDPAVNDGFFFLHQEFSMAPRSFFKLSRVSE